ncbi:hypothetical protein [Streptomyces radicis]|uniref:Uncharacterized protein n=1 Tax=Streptomyces radicis TaxID=1750517 RepID=A0A3A9VQX6_9ACTN|nr:hypothetical protein [Streptomyces radicis]RKN03521.1 hypothetical protein D7319_31390 [Streptomyces radicis]RKN20329.1 hypothetical protein D7318_19510 [Streptomyces radicis]
MSVLTTYARLRAAEAGRAEPLATVRHVHLAARPFVLIPLALAGEACAPLAALVGAERERPELLIVAEPRDRTQRFAFVADLADRVLPHLDSFTRDTEEYTGRRDGAKRILTRCTEAPQILVPNPGGIAFLRLLGRSTRFRGTEGPHAVPPGVPLLGKWLTWFTDRAEFPGSSQLLAMTEALSVHWATGQSGTEDGNLASLIGWIAPPDGHDGHEAARLAEDPALRPPAGPATDPVFDHTLHELLDRYERAGTDPLRAALRHQLEKQLRSQLAPTWDLMWRGVDLLRSLPPGASVAGRWEFDRTLFTDYAAYLAETGLPQARRDHAVGAARRLARLEDATARYELARAYDDPLVMAEHELAGRAFTGVVIATDPSRMVKGPRSALFRPLVTLRTDALPPRLELGDKVKSPTRRDQPARLLAVRALPDGDAEIDLELEGGLARKRKPPAPPGCVPEPGEELCYTVLDTGHSPLAFPDDEATPWTHGGPPTPYTPTEDDADEAWE